MPSAGSPPRAWGQLPARILSSLAMRFTPTRVGTTFSASARRVSSAVHPHARGDNFGTGGVGTTVAGSPPRAWGQLFRSESGKKYVPVHPHARGDNYSPSHSQSVAVGSPPRAWGQHHCAIRRRDTRRFTPTRVGTTRTVPTPTSQLSVHPHARGDNDWTRKANIETAGSPPRAWGQLFLRDGQRRSVRFTPTRVGTTARWGTMMAAQSVHPHARGDNSISAHSPGPPRGSPPRAWGQRKCVQLCGHRARFTPTRVGTTSETAIDARSTPVHPHARGDNSVRISIRPPHAGSPPRAWGQPKSQALQLNRTRFTPTRVGTTSAPDPWLSRMAGSPPRAWGQLRHQGQALAAVRFTPTRVGTTRPGRPAPCPQPVHPHARGDNAAAEAP